MTAMNAAAQATIKIHNGMPKNEVGFESFCFMDDAVLVDIGREREKGCDGFSDCELPMSSMQTL